MIDEQAECESLEHRLVTGTRDKFQRVHAGRRYERCIPEMGVPAVDQRRDGELELQIYRA